MEHRRSSALCSAALAAGLLAVAALGPLGLDVIRYRYSPSMVNQAVGLDAFAAAVVAPLALVAAVLTWRRHRLGPVLAMGPAAFALYMLVQYVIGPDHTGLEGNGERGFPLFAGLFVLAGITFVRAWSSAEPAPVPRRRGTLLLVLAGFVVVGMYLANGFLGALADFPEFAADRAATTEYDEHPTAYWLVAWLDLAVVVPLTVAAGLGVRRARPWAAKAYWAALGWFALVPGSVAAMALTMVARHDVAADGGRAAVFTVVAAALLALAGRSVARSARNVRT